ncbi:MAG TPA: tetratricopeptide repeat protein, partial [Tepidisphaeraceae bacterium]|nr:tetratricopeptide repeat protein [Tepidisphaeraceae bacterium]
IEIALEQHRAGQFARAEALYIEILKQDPGNVDAIHLLGVLAHQGHKPEIAVDLISAAIQKKPDMPIFHYNLAEALHALKRKEEALAAYQRAVELAPDYFEAQNNLANLLNELGRYTEAESACRRALEIDPAAAAPLNNLGNALRGLCRREEAAAAFRLAIEKKSEFVEAMSNLAMCLCSMGQFDEGIEQFRKAIQLSPAVSDVHNNLGVALVSQGKNEEAAVCFQTAIDLKPDHAEAHNNLGSALRSLGKTDEALPFFEKALELKADFVEARSNLVAALADVGRKEDALREVDAVLAVRPNSAKDHFVRGIILRDLLRFDEAIESIRESLRLDTNNVAAITSLGYALQERGDIDEAMSALKRSIELKPDPQTHSNVLMTINYHPGYSPTDLLKAHQGWAELHEKPHIANWKPHTNDRSPDRKLRIGYVSPDFRGHSVSFFMEPILENHDHEHFEVFGYAHLASPDMNTWRLRASVDQWRETIGMNADKIADLIREDQIDILVELAGHTANNSMAVFVRKPAPVQINMIGFPSTTGLTSIDYRITDDNCDPPGETDAFNTESLIRMPGVFWCYLPPHGAPEIGALPADNGTVTFTSVNNFTKVTPDVQRLWAKILAAVPNSKLIMQTTAVASQHTQKFVQTLFAEYGVSPDRLDFRRPTGMKPYLELLERSDMTLDPFPFNGGTTTCHSLWMGAPVVTLAGDRHASRMSMSMLKAIGLPEFVAHTPDEYVQIAVQFANNLPRLREIRAGMRERMQASPLLDGMTYTRNLEAAYRRVWQTWCASAPTT